jgi:hypothetical protein
MAIIFHVLLTAGLFVQAAGTGDKKAEEQLPPVRVEVEPDWPEGEPVLPYERINRYDVWQYYAVGRQGRFRPRVAYSPEESYYLYNGEPYLYLPIRTRDFMPYATD